MVSQVASVEEMKVDKEFTISVAQLFPVAQQIQAAYKLAHYLSLLPHHKPTSEYRVGVVMGVASTLPLTAATSQAHQ